MTVLLNDETGMLVLYKSIIKIPGMFEQIYKSGWKQETLVMCGKTVYPKRYTCSYGNVGTTYKYSGKQESSVEWSTNQGILNLKNTINNLTGYDYNYVLCNLYLDHTFSIGYHSDDEKGLDSKYPICSVSLGATREFRVQPKTKKFAAINKPRPKLMKINLSDGDILLMGGNLQKYWKHCIFKSPEVCGPRINLTFRKIKP